MSSWNQRRRAAGWASILGALAGCPATPPQFPEAGTTGTSGGSTSGAPDPTFASGADDDGGSGHATVGSGTGPAPDPSAGTDDGPTADTTTADAPPEDRAFRINSLELRDPHLYYGFGGDVTDVFNDQFASWLEPQADGGAISLGLVFDFQPLDQSDGAKAELVFSNASCSGRDANTCEPSTGSEPYLTTYTSRVSGPCLAPDPDHLNPSYEEPQGPASNCFTTDPFDVVVFTDAVDLPLQSSEVSAQYVGDPSSNLVAGLLRGFVPVAVAQDTPVQVEGLGQAALSTLLEPDDRDQVDGVEGWWFYFQFTALVATWTPG